MTFRAEGGTWFGDAGADVVSDHLELDLYRGVLTRRARFEVGADHRLARVLHLHLFHLLQTVSNNSVGIDVGVPARGLHSEAYRGHVFWDEVILPLLGLRFPQTARALVHSVPGETIEVLLSDPDEDAPRPAPAEPGPRVPTT